MTFDEIVDNVSFWIDAVPANSAPQRAAAQLVRYRSGGHSPSGDVTARDYARVAVHEASHAAVARSAGLTLTHAQVNPDGSGEAAYSRDAAAIDRRMATIATDLSGVVGELFSEGASARRRWALSNSFDIAQARAGIEGFRQAAPSWNMPTRTFAIVALAAVYAHWPAIQRIARVLRERRALTASEIDGLCERGQ
jgi:hypothetical protein